MRILFSSTWGFGHVFPMVPLAKALTGAGHEVLWATSSDAGDLVASAGLDVLPAGLAGDELAELRCRLGALASDVAPVQRAAFMYPRLFGEGATPPMVADLLPLARDWRPDLLVHEQGELAAPLVGALLGVPVVAHSFGGAVPAELIADAGERLAPLWAQHGLTIPPHAGCFISAYLDICPPEVQSVPLGHLARVQPLRPVPYTGEESGALPACIEDGGPPLVYLTLGTVQNRSPVLRAAVQALADLPIRVLVTVGPDGDADALGSQPPHVTVERWVPQTQALPHCAVVVSHAGSGTFLGTLAQGLPQLCLPQAADQFRNAQGGLRSGAALALNPPDATASAIAEAVRRLLDEESFRSAAGRVAEAIREMPSPAEVVAVLEQIAGSDAREAALRP